MTPQPSSPNRHVRNESLSEAVLIPQAIIDVDNAAAPAMNGSSDVSVDLAEHHEALIGAEFRNPTNIIKQPTLATLGDTPFAEDGEEIEHHRIVATEIVKDPLDIFAENILQNAIVLLDP